MDRLAVPRLLLAAVGVLVLAPVAIRAEVPDLSITISGNPASVLPGDHVEYTVTVRCALAAADTPRATLGMPVGTTFWSITVDDSIWYDALPAVGAVGTAAVTWEGMEAGGSDTFTVDVVVDEDVPPGATLQAGAWVFDVAGDTDANFGNNVATVTTMVKKPEQAGSAGCASAGGAGLLSLLLLGLTVLRSRGRHARGGGIVGGR